MIVRAGPAHAAAMAAIHAEVFAAGPEALWGRPWGAESFAAQLRLPGALGFIDPAGGALLARVLGSEAELLTLAVVAAARRRGLGFALVSAAMGAAASAGAERIVLEVAAANTPALALYEKSGFSRIGLRRAYYADHSDALLLAALLPRPPAPGRL